MLTIFQSVFLGALQGITEFLPISSSGHLVVFQQLFGWQAGNGVILAFDVALHVGTLFAVLLAFWKDIWMMLSGRAWRLLALLAVATIPAVIIGFSFNDFIEGLFTSVKFVGFSWLFTGTFLWCTRYMKEEDGADDIPSHVSWIRSLLIGCCQALAIVPGISRSGSTIAGGMFLKVPRSVAAKFAFLMAIPAIGGGAILDVKDLVNFPRAEMPQLIIGTLVSFIVGYLSIKWLLRVIQRGKFWYFGVYCWVAGTATLLYFSF